MSKSPKRILICLLLSTTVGGLAGCGGAQSDRETVAAWIDARQADLPLTLDRVSLTELRHYENQVIATLTPGEAESIDALPDTQAFDLVSSAVCGLQDVDVVWNAEHVLYTSIESRTIQTKRFDCCVIASMATMSREEAQNSCPYP